MKSLESAAFIGGFISAHYIKLYIKCSWKPPGSPAVKRRFQMRKTGASNISSFCLHLQHSFPFIPRLPLHLSPRKCLLFFLSRSFLFWEKPIYSNVHVYMEMNLPASLLFWRFTKTLFPHDTLIRGQLGRWAAVLMIRFWVMEELSGEQREDRAKVMTSCPHSSSMSFCSLETCLANTPGLMGNGVHLRLHKTWIYKK